MKIISSFAEFGSRLREFMAASKADDVAFNRLALALFALQFAHVVPYRKLCLARHTTPDKVTHWTEIPPAPTAAFKEFEMSSLPIYERTSVFHSSGTTEQRPSRHFHGAESLAIYEASLQPWFKAHLLPDCDKVRFVILAPSPALAPHSSLAQMFETVRSAFGSPDSVFTAKPDEHGAWLLDTDSALRELLKSCDGETVTVVLGTAFSFVHLLDHLAERNLRLDLHSGSRVMETGGYKGRSRVVPKGELYKLITHRLGIPDSNIICEYGMSELSSQAYDHAAGGQALPSNAPAVQRVFHFPPWAKARIVSPESGEEVAEGEAGLIRVFDLANVRSVLAIQTEDLGVRRGDGFELIGRAARAEPRGCSLLAS